jgi:hypothetical protein
VDDLQQLKAERACERLIVDYTRLVDFGEAGRIAELFTDDGRWEGTDLVLEGREQIAEWFAKREGVTRRISRHICTNVGIDVLSEDDAEGTCILVNYRFDRRDGDTSFPVPGDIPKYVADIKDRFRRTPDGWRFSHRQVDVAFLRPRGAPAARG